MSPNLLQKSKVLAIASENEVAGHTLVEDGMFSWALRVGRMMLKPETKYSVRIWLMATAITKVISDRAFWKHGGLSLPSRCIF